MDQQQHQLHIHEMQPQTQGEHQMMPPISEVQLAPPGFGPPGTQGWSNDVYIGKNHKLIFLALLFELCFRSKHAKQHERPSATFTTTNGR